MASCGVARLTWGIPKIGGTILGGPIIRIIVFWGLYWDSPYFGKLSHDGRSVFVEIGSDQNAVFCANDCEFGHQRPFPRGFR